MRILSHFTILACIILSCSETPVETEETITVDVSSIEIYKSGLPATASNLDGLRFEMRVNGLKQTNILMNNFVSATWTSDIFGQIVYSNIKSLNFNFFSVSLPSGNHKINLKIETTDSTLNDSISILITDFSDFPITYQDANWTNYSAPLIRHIIVDTSNSKWFASSGYGLIKFDNSNFKTMNDYDLRKTGNYILQSFDIQSIALDPLRNIVYGGYYTDSYVTQVNQDSIQSFRIDKQNATIDIHSILADPDGTLWLGMHNSTFVHYYPSIDSVVTISGQPSIGQINFLRFSTDNKVLGAGLFPNLFLYENGNWSVLLNAIAYTSVTFDSDGNLWAGTAREGLTKFDGIDQTFYNLANSYIPSNVIRDIEIDKKGQIWIATQNGIAKFDGTNWKLYNTINSPISSDDTRTIAVDSTNQIWIGSDQGISVFRGDEL